MKLKKLPVKFCHQLDMGMIIRVGKAKLLVCRRSKPQYQHPAGTVQNELRNKVWVVPADKPEPQSQPQLACFDLILGDNVKVYQQIQ